MSEDLNKLRADYKELVGKNAFNGWNALELQKRIDEALADGSPSGDESGSDASAPVPTISVTIKRDIWDDDGNRHRKGAEVEMPVEDAMDAVEAGTVTRVKKA
jgi:hypothetical protein